MYGHNHSQFYHVPAVLICACVLTKSISSSLIIASMMSPIISRAAMIDTAIIQGATVAAQPTMHYTCNTLYM